MIIEFRTRGNVTPRGKQKVFLALLAEESYQLRERLLCDILDVADVAVYFPIGGEHASKEQIHVEEEQLEEYLKEFMLVVIPVTENLLFQNNVIKDKIYPFARQEKPLIPIIMEEGLLDEYGEMFGNIQFLDPDGLYRKGEDEIPYIRKLKTRFQEVLVTEEERKEIQNAFRAMIFLSYRKVDRREAQQLMRMLHSDSECEDIAIWYDEFLVPGEDFNELIKKAMDDADIISLNVTENLLELYQGNPNYVMAQEYPNARSSGKPILPVEMRKTDREVLREKYEGIDEEFVGLEEHENIPVKLRLFLEKLKKELNNKYPQNESISQKEKQYYLGLAYLGGINLEMDVDKAEAYLKQSAGAGFVRAMKRLSIAYKTGELGSGSIEESAYWLKAAVEVERELLFTDMDQERVEAFGEDLFALWDIYDSQEDDEGKAFCKKTIRDSLEKGLDGMEEKVYDTTVRLLLECAYRSKDSSFCQEILDKCDKTYKESSDIVEGYKKLIRFRADAAFRMKKLGFIQGAGNALATLEMEEYRNSITDEEMIDLYLKIAQAGRSEYCKPPQDVMVDLQYFADEFPYAWDSIQKGLALAEAVLDNQPENFEWKLKKANMLFERGQLIAQIRNLVPHKWVASDAEEMMMKSIQDAAEIYGKSAEAAFKRNEMEPIIERIKEMGRILFGDGCYSSYSLDGIRYYRIAIDLAEKLVAQDASRENLLLLWRTLKYCGDMNVGYEIPDKAIETAEKLRNMDGNTVASRMRLAAAFELKADLYYRHEGDHEKAVEEKDSYFSEEDKEELRKNNRNALRVYHEIFGDTSGKGDAYRRWISEMILKRYLCADESDSELLREGLEFLDTESKTEPLCLPWDWFAQWDQINAIKLDKKDMETEGILKQRWIDILDEQIMMAQGDTSGEKQPYWFREKDVANVLSRYDLYHLRFAYWVWKKDKKKVAKVIAQYKRWYDDHLIEEPFEAEWLRRWKHIEGLDGQTDLLALIRMNQIALEMDCGDPVWQADMLMDDGQKEEALSWYRCAIERNEKIIARLEAEQDAFDKGLLTQKAKNNFLWNKRMLLPGLKEDNEKYRKILNEG